VQVTLRCLLIFLVKICIFLIFFVFNIIKSVNPLHCLQPFQLLVLLLVSIAAAVLYGRGVYFATQFSLAASNTYAVPDMNGNKHVYLSRVLTGDYTQGHQTYIVPPPKPGTAGGSNRYDSVVDNPSAPGIFVIFYDSQAYPEYLVIFK